MHDAAANTEGRDKNLATCHLFSSGTCGDPLPLFQLEYRNIRQTTRSQDPEFLGPTKEFSGLAGGHPHHLSEGKPEGHELGHGGGEIVDGSFTVETMAIRGDHIRFEPLVEHPVGHLEAQVVQAMSDVEQNSLSPCTSDLRQEFSRWHPQVRLDGR